MIAPDRAFTVGKHIDGGRLQPVVVVVIAMAPSTRTRY